VVGTMGMKMVLVVINASILTGLDACKTPTRLCGGLRSYQQRDIPLVSAITVILGLLGHVAMVILKWLSRYC